ncbi:head-tail connector protein [Mesorhizobium muleiense]|uniref:head-tail connector protein n=1 Tax=Mesorhizobium muleiense TaxID=1004279 RepID=UPI001F3D9C7C|nr:head-tail connector protein [Mesorhizobium muleiense]MCF6111993.1 head-tail connector protein [Mesorhizobium muleiense]
MLIRLSQPSGLVVSVEDVKAQAVIDTADDDTLLEAYIRAATRFAEDRTGRILLSAEFEWRADGWCEPIAVPVVPIREVSEVVYLDDAQVEQTLAPADWYQVETTEGVEIRFTDAFSSPSLSDRRNRPVRVRFTAGYDEPDVSGSGDDPELKQDPMDRLIVMILVAHWYQSREPVAIGATVASIPFSADALIAMRRIFR